MATADTTDTTTPTLPPGEWVIDPTVSELGFRARGAFGLATVRGRFTDYAGTLQVDDDGARGELKIDAATLDTANPKRDKHLRSADFFDVDRHPEVTFSLDGVDRAADGSLSLSGVLQIRETTLRIAAPLKAVVAGPDRLQLQTEVSVNRSAAGVGWSKMGMVRGKAHLNAALVLLRRA